MLVDLQTKYAYKPGGLAATLNALDYATQVEGLFSLEELPLSSRVTGFSIV